MFYKLYMYYSYEKAMTELYLHTLQDEPHTRDIGPKNQARNNVGSRLCRAPGYSSAVRVVELEEQESGPCLSREEKWTWAPAAQLCYLEVVPGAWVTYGS